MSELWRPSRERIQATRIWEFAGLAAARGGPPRPSDGSALVSTLHRWSVVEPESFWSVVWEFAGIESAEAPDVVVDDATRMPGAVWFRGVRLNFAEYLLRRLTDVSDSTDALVSWNEEGRVRSLTRSELRDEALRFGAALRRVGVRPGDRVAGFIPNVIEAVVAMLGASSVGAIWTACSSDFGSEGALDRLRQARPRVLVCGPCALWKGEWRSATDHIVTVAEELSTAGLETLVVAEYGLGDPADLARTLADRLPPELEIAEWRAFLDEDEGDHPHQFEPLPFDHPLYLLYSSGTTGLPKCIVHGQGGTLLQHLKELTLHTDLRAADRIFYYTTCGWMMWNWLVTSLGVGATVILWDGSPLSPDDHAMWDLIDAERITHFGTSAKYLALAEKRGLRPRASHDLGSLRCILSTGSPLLPSSFEWVYEAVKHDVHLASISGGTDIVSCFLLGDPTAPVQSGELQCAGLGMRVEAWREDATPAAVDEPGELVCTAAFPSLPIGFWGDPEGALFRAAYFDHFDVAPPVWRHGDWVSRTPTGGWVVHGRSDTTLNPGGVRIGTAEIYRQVETLDEVIECVAVGREADGDVAVLLYVVLRNGLELDSAMRDRIRSRIRSGTTARHVPARIEQVPELPRTASGKISEIAVHRAVNGRTVPNRSTLANPEALRHFESDAGEHHP